MVTMQVGVPEIGSGHDGGRSAGWRVGIADHRPGPPAQVVGQLGGIGGVYEGQAISERLQAHQVAQQQHRT